jgi:two-component system, NarL family, sensor kinase
VAHLRGVPRLECGPGCTHHQELTRLRRDLHDGLGPSLAGIMVRADVLAQLMNRDKAGAQEVLRDLRREASSFLAEVRRVLAARDPAELDDRDLSVALTRLASRTHHTSGVHVEVLVDDRVSLTDWDSQVAAFWIVREALTNVVKHSSAATCTVRVWLDGDLCLSVVDDGRGGLDRSGVGLGSMRERAHELGGWCEVVDTGRGVTVSAQIPGGRHDRAA